MRVAAYKWLAVHPPAYGARLLLAPVALFSRAAVSRLRRSARFARTKFPTELATH